jgi:hypothetical protein
MKPRAQRTLQAFISLDADSRLADLLQMAKLGPASVVEEP